MLRIGRTVINVSKVTKVVHDSKLKVTTINFDNGSKAVYKKHGVAAWNYFKGATVSVQVVAPSAPTPQRSRW